MNLLETYPKTRINDKFATGETNLNFTCPAQNYKHPLIQGRPNEEFRFNADFYKKIGVDIVTETAFEYPYTFVTEKTYRSMASLRPFIVVGPCQTLHFLKSFEFQTFSAIINEEYDTIRDPVARFNSVCVSIKKFVSRPIDMIKKDIESVSDVLLHNAKILSQLNSYEFERFKSQI